MPVQAVSCSDPNETCVCCIACPSHSSFLFFSFLFFFLFASENPGLHDQGRSVVIAGAHTTSVLGENSAHD